jgi:beta-1,4-mannosyl-glycoprotein beta-1,4-N-acetylglucosaminyltransferase
MNKIKVVDCFLYFNEKELLELRINLLKDYVDGFMIIESDHTHGGHAKSFSCWDTLKELNLEDPKIQVIQVYLPSYEEEKNNYVREKGQRDVAKRYFEEDTVYIVSDCDEIIDPNRISKYVDGCVSNKDKILRIPLDYLIGRADLQAYHPNGLKQSWMTPFVCMKHHTEKYTLSQIRDAWATDRTIDYPDLFPLDKNGHEISCGWHFSWMGDTERIKTKMKSFLHCYDTPEKQPILASAIGAVNSPEMMEYLDNYVPKVGASDPYGRKDHILKPYPLENLPQKIFELERVKKFLLKDI